MSSSSLSSSATVSPLLVAIKSEPPTTENGDDLQTLIQSDEKEEAVEEGVTKTTRKRPRRGQSADLVSQPPPSKRTKSSRLAVSCACLPLPSSLSSSLRVFFSDTLQSNRAADIKKEVKTEIPGSESLEIASALIKEEKKMTKKNKKKGNGGREGWEITYERIQEYRESHRDAPVDTMGCGSLSETDKEPNVFRFQTLVSLMLSSQTRDEVR